MKKEKKSPKPKGSITNKEVLNLFESLRSINLRGVKFAYAVARNLALLKPEVESILKAREDSDEYKKFEVERVALCEEYAEKGENGKPIIEGETYKIRDQKAFDKKMEALKKANKKLMTAREAQIKEFEELLEREIPITFHKISLKDIPEEITTFQLTSIISIVDEDEE